MWDVIGSVVAIGLIIGLAAPIVLGIIIVIKH